MGDRSFRVTAARAWNRLPTSVTHYSYFPGFLQKTIKDISFH